MEALEPEIWRGRNRDLPKHLDEMALLLWRIGRGQFRLSDSVRVATRRGPAVRGRPCRLLRRSLCSAGTSGKPLSHLDLEELLAERGIEVVHVTLFRWVQRFTRQLIDAARPRRHAASDRWFTGETCIKVNGIWRYVPRAVEQHGQVLDVFVSRHADIALAGWFFTASLRAHRTPTEVATSRAPAVGCLAPVVLALPGVIERSRDQLFDPA